MGSYHFGGRECDAGPVIRARGSTAIWPQFSNVPKRPLKLRLWRWPWPYTRTHNNNNKTLLSLPSLPLHTSINSLLLSAVISAGLICNLQLFVLCCCPFFSEFFASGGLNEEGLLLHESFKAWTTSVKV